MSRAAVRQNSYMEERCRKSIPVLLVFGLITLTAARSGFCAGDPGTTSQVSGTVVDDHGRPVADASVECYHYQAPSGLAGTITEEPELRQHAVTDAKGAFTVSSSPGTTLALVKKPGLAPSWRIWASTLADSPDPVVLGPPTILAGVVVDENHQPVAGAEVRVAGAIVGNRRGLWVQENRLLGKLARECFSAQTAADGRFRIENFPAEALAGLAVSKPGKAQCPSANGSTGSAEFGSGRDDIELMLGPAGAIEGKVIDDDSGRPLGTVKLWLEPASAGLYRPQSREPVASAAYGEFRIPDVQPGDYRILATMPGQPVPEWVGVPPYARVTVLAGETLRGVLIHMTRGVLVEVKVVSTNTTIPIANVAITAGQATAYTGANGIAMMRVLPGTPYFSALSAGYFFPVRNIAEIEPGRTNHFQIEADPSPRIRGLVRDPAGAPAPGVLVSFHPGHYPGANPYAEVQSDEGGRYDLILEKSPYVGFRGGIHPTNFILARSLQRKLAAMVEFVQIPTTLDLSLQPGITLSGSLKDTAGAPISNATVQASVLAAGSVVAVQERPNQVDAQGAFSIPALPQGREYAFLSTGIAARGYGSSSGHVTAEFTITSHYEFPPFVLKRAGLMLAGYVLDLDGKPVTGATISCGGEGQPPFTRTQSDSKGHFEFNNVIEGPVLVSTSHVVTVRGGSRSVFDRVQANGGDTNVVLWVGNR